MHRARLLALLGLSGLLVVLAGGIHLALACDYSWLAKEVKWLAPLAEWLGLPLDRDAAPPAPSVDPETVVDLDYDDEFSQLILQGGNDTQSSSSRPGSSRLAPPATRPGKGKAWSYGIAKSFWLDVYAQPDPSSRRLTQLLVGDEVKIKSIRGGWARVQLGSKKDPEGWVNHSGLAGSDVRDASGWSKSEVAQIATISVYPGISRRGLPLIPCGAQFPIRSTESTEPVLLLPNGSTVGVAPDQILAPGSNLSLEAATQIMLEFRQVGYQQGANTYEAMDAPGLIHLLHRLAGISVPRTLEGLMEDGESVSPDLMQAGDVLFYSTYDQDKPHPVVLLRTGDTFLEASPAQGVGIGRIEQMRNRKLLMVKRYS